RKLKLLADGLALDAEAHRDGIAHQLEALARGRRGRQQRATRKNDFGDLGDAVVRFSAAPEHHAVVARREGFREVVVVGAGLRRDDGRLPVDDQLEVVDLIRFDAGRYRGAVETRREAGAGPRKARAGRGLFDATQPA